MTPCYGISIIFHTKDAGNMDNLVSKTSFLKKGLTHEDEGRFKIGETTDYTQICEG
jgi:hypothetical protein